MSNETIIETVEEIVEEVSEVIEDVAETLEESFTNLKQKSKGIPETDADNVIGSSRTNAKGGKKTGAVTTTTNGAIDFPVRSRLDRQICGKRYLPQQHQLSFQTR